MLSSDEDEVLKSDDKMYATQEQYRHDHPWVMSPREFRYEVYLRFVDKFCREQGTVMLVFAGAKPISSCAVSSLLVSIVRAMDSLNHSHMVY